MLGIPLRLAMMLLALGIAACTAATPTPTPTAPPSPTATATPVATPTATATATPTVTPTPTPIPHATGASDVLVQMETRGGFAPEVTDRTVNPDFTLYGDGTLLYVVYDQAANREVLQGARLSEEAVQEVLRRVVEEARLFDSKGSYTNPNVADVGTTRVTVRAAERCQSVYAYGLEFDILGTPENMTAEDLAQFNRLAELRQWLLEVGGVVQDEEVFIPETMHLFIGPFEGALQGVMPWPFPYIDLEFFAYQPNPPAQVYLTDDLASGIYQFLIDTDSSVFSQGAGLYSVTYRPHLPYEQEWRGVEPCTGEALS